MTGLVLGLTLAASPVPAKPNAGAVLPTDTAYVGAEGRLTIPLSDRLRPAAGERLAVFIGHMDLTPLVVPAGDSLVYDGAIVPLPAGETEVTVYRVTATQDWSRLAVIPIRSVTVVSKDTADGSGLPTASLSLTLTGELRHKRARSTDPTTTRETTGNGTLQSTIRHRLAHRRVQAESRFDLAGASREEEALRFAERGEAAPQVDLSSYEVRLERGGVALQAGHFSFGTNRHLVDGFATRGVTLHAPLHRGLDVAVAAMNGTNVVGFGNFFGIGRSRHRIVTGTAGLELMPRSTGALRVEVSGLSGSLLPESGFTAGGITDAEESRGLAVRVLAGQEGGRLRLEGGITRSTFANPNDPLLAETADIVPVRQTTDGARYLDARYDLLRDLRVTATRSAGLTAVFRHERVDPLFRSVGAAIQANRLQDELELTGSLGEVTIAARHIRSRDNLDRISSLLTTLTRQTGLNAGLPLTTLLARGQAIVWLPTITYGLDRIRQFAGAVPEGEQFQDPSFIPDQLSTNHSLTAGWQIGRWRASYSLNRTIQDNRQPGREQADFATTVNALSLGVTASDALDLGVELGAERASNRELGSRDRTLRAAGTLNWRWGGESVFAASLSATTLESGTSSSRSNLELDTQWSRRLMLGKWLAKEVAGQVFARIAFRSERSSDTALETEARLRRWTGTAGWSVTLP